MSTLGEAAVHLRSALSRPPGGPDALRDLLLQYVHDPVVTATATGDELPRDALAALADAVRDHVPVGAEQLLAPRARILVALLRHGTLEPAWTLAQDNGSGSVVQQVGFATSSGAARTSVALPLPTVIEGERVFAWLPGFRDPRWDVPDAVYDLTGDVRLSARAETAELSGDCVVLAGSAQLSVLPTDAGESVAVILTGPDRAPVRVPGQRLRRPDRVGGSRLGLTELAYAGWAARISRTLLDGGPWQVGLELGHGGISRVTPLGGDPGPLLALGTLTAPGWILRIHRDGADLCLQARRRGPLARVGAAARRLPSDRLPAH